MSLGKILANSDILEVMIEQKFDEWFRQYAEKTSDERLGLHASSIVASDKEFCYREHVLAYYYETSPPDIPTNLLKIFEAGNSIHEKWQNVFQQAGVFVQIEHRRMSELWSVYLTPDAIIRLLNKMFVVEIKSMNTFQFQKLKAPPANAVRQIQFYMHLCSIPYGIILVEDKNTQAIKVFVVRYDPHVAREFVDRLYKVKMAIKIHRKKGNRLPKRLCRASSDKRADRCACKEACFASKKKRRKMIKKRKGKRRNRAKKVEV